MAAHPSSVVCQRFGRRSLRHVGSAAPPRVAGLRLAARADVPAGLHVLFFSRFFSLVFPAACIRLNGLLGQAWHIPGRRARCAVERRHAIVHGIKLLHCLFSPNSATASWH